MNLNDPFNRLSKKQQREYQAFQQQLQQAGIDSEDKANALMTRSRKRMLSHCLMVVVICIAVVLFAPHTLAMVSVLGTVALLWLLMTVTRGERMLKRYIQQELVNTKKVD